MFVLKPEIAVFVVNDFGLATLENYQLMASYSIDPKLIDNPDLISIISTMVLEGDKNYDYEKDSSYLKVRKLLGNTDLMSSLLRAHFYVIKVLFD